MKEINVKLIVVTVFVATFMAAIEGTIISTAMPTIVSSLNGLGIMNWIFSIYLLTSAVTVPIYGKLADLFGKKKIFIISTIIFVVGSTLCGFATSIEQMILFRAIQGLGAGGIYPTSMTIVADVFPYEKRAKIMGLLGTAWGIAGVAGPLVGGFFVDKLTWHWIFFINIPVGIATIVLIAIGLKEKVNVAKQQIDYWGALLFTSGLLCLLLALQFYGEDLNVMNAQAFSLLVASVVIFVIFYFVEKRAADPIVPFELFKNRTILVGNLIAFLISAYVMGIDVYIPMWMQGIRGHGATISGLILAPLSVAWFTGSFIAGRLLVTIGNKRTIGIASIVLLLGGLMLSGFGIGTPEWQFALNSAVLGLGFGMIFTTTTVNVQDAVPATMVGTATASITLFRTVGQAVGLAVFGMIFNSLLLHNMGNAADDAINASQMNQLISTHHLGNVAPALVGPLREILYQSLHFVYWSMLGFILISFALHFLLPSGLREPSQIKGSDPV
ncbi:DHA2 family efflux MFS transporter permease subunit [Paenibacillaceae bacterium]|nr:DHA2 family efflux MFS transporter permease subunit [Paenibacillaceae bacterium]